MVRNLKKVILGLLLGVLPQAWAGDYTNNVRSIDDRDYSSFRIQKSDRSIQHLEWLQIPITTGIVCSNTPFLLAFSATASDPILVQVASLTGDIKLRLEDGVISRTAYVVSLPDGFISGGDLVIVASAPANVATDTFLGVTLLQNDTASTTLADVSVDSGSFETLEVDFSAVSLSAKDKVTLLIFRNDSTSGSGPLEIRSIGIRTNKNIPFAE